ncbi:MAG: DEAD/DEAH box helicase [Planctomycetota bacterium]
MVDTHADDAPATSESAPSEQAEQQAPNESQEDRPRKRRRRRGRRRGKSEGEQQQSAGEAAPTSEADESAPSSDDGGERKPRRRRRRRGGKREGDAGGDGGDDGDGSNARARSRSRAPAPDNVENWEEIFEKQTFADIGLRNSVVKGCEAAGFTYPTKIQAELIPLVLEGKDVLGQSRTGTGKTAAFGLPLFHLAQRNLAFQSIILAPTRELAIQIAEELRDLGRFTPIRVSAVYGGQRIETQARNLEEGPEIIVATPGRLWDMKQRGHLHFNNVRFAVLDEVDRMLDIGFREDIKQILRAIKSEHQTVFVSATISDEIEKLSRAFMTEPAKLETAGSSLTVSMVKQHYITVQPWDKRRMLHHLLTHEDPDLTIVFCRMKRTVDNVTKYLKEKGIDAHAIHGDMYQGKRNSVMDRLRSGRLSVIVASDLAARGLDVDNITHVINYDLPEDPEVYVHRIGRTARAGRDGVAWALVPPDQGPLLTAIEMLANIHIPEKQYPEFEAGPVPRNVREERERDEQRLAKATSQNRFDAPKVPKKARENDPRFPGGVVPTKLPPKRLGGRARTARSKPAPGAED